jgi:hypothetical protein
VPFLFVLPIVGFVAACYAIVAGLHGRRIGDHPHCRRCGYDLFGAPAERKLCPECGGQLGEQNVVIGQRVRRPKHLWVGCCLLLFTLPMLLAVIAGSLGTLDLNQYKPLWWLKLDVRHNRATVASGAMREILNRASAGSVATAELVPFLRSITPIRVRVRPVLRHGDAIPYDLSHAKTPAPPEVLGFGTQLTLQQIHAGDEVVFDASRQPTPAGPTWGPHSTVHMERDLSPEAWRRIPPGDHTFRFVFSCQLASIDVGTITFEQKVKVVEPPGDSVQLIGSETVSNEYVAGAVRMISYPDRKSTILIKPNTQAASVTIDPLPCALACVVIVRDSRGCEWRVGTVVVEKGVRTGTYLRPAIGANDSWTNFDADRVDVIFRPDPEIARHNTFATEIFGEEIVIRDVPVQWAPEVPRPIP